MLRMKWEHEDFGLATAQMDGLMDFPVGWWLLIESKVENFGDARFHPAVRFTLFITIFKLAGTTRNAIIECATTATLRHSKKPV